MCFCIVVSGYVDVFLYHVQSIFDKLGELLPRVIVFILCRESFHMRKQNSVPMFRNENFFNGFIDGFCVCCHVV